MLIAARNRILGGGKKLPYLTELEWIATDGSSHLIIPNNIFIREDNAEFTIKAATASASFSQISSLLSSGKDTYSGLYFIRINADGSTRLGVPGNNWFELYSDTAAHEIRCVCHESQSISLTVNNPYVSSVETKTFGDYVGVFSYNDGSGQCARGTRIYSITSKRGDGTTASEIVPVLTHDFIPCFYDKVSGTLLNTPTGSFIAGPAKGWVNPYVTDGLVAMWDGEWNAAGGVHNANATTWKDLVGTRDATLSGAYSWGENFWDVQSVSGQGLATWDGLNLPSSQTWEIVIHPSATTGYGRIVAEAQGIASPIIENRVDRLYMYGYGRDNASEFIDGYSNLDLHSHVIVHPSGGPFDYYIDGVQQWTQTTSNDSTGSTSAFFANRANLQRGLDAKYYSVRLYSRAFTAQEIAANYAVDKARFNLA